MIQSKCKECISHKLEDCIAADCEVLNTFVARQFATKLRMIHERIENLPKEPDQPKEGASHDELYQYGYYVFQLNMALQTLSSLSDIDNYVHTEKHMIDLCRHRWRLTKNGSHEVCVDCGKYQSSFEEIIFHQPDKDADIITLDSFIATCKAGGFIDYDGYGKYMIYGKVSNLTVHPSQIMAGKIDRRFTHVDWYNR